LLALESATSDWTNVLNQVYTMRTTIFKDNAFTGCLTYNVCTTNSYTLGQKTAKARLISVQEASSLGCTKDLQSCPVWMYNYLNNSTGYGGTVDQTGDIYGKNWGYWTMNANSSNSSAIWNIFYSGYLSSIDTTGNTRGGRAVVVIEK